MSDLVNFRLVGHGGFSTVYVAEQVSLGRDVAVKVLNTSIADAVTWDRFERECRVAGRLSSHAGVVSVFSAHRTETNVPYLVMEYLEGGSLSYLLSQRGSLTAPQVVRVGKEVGNALKYAHEAGVVHRDIKPENLLLDGDGNIKLADFGIATLSSATAKSSTSSSFTPDHVAPEVLRGEKATQASDVFSLCSTLYQALEGRSPYRASSDDSIATVLTRKVTGEPLQPVMSAPAALLSMIRSGLASAPADRPTIDEVLTQLDALPAEPLLASNQPRLRHPVVPTRAPDGIAEEASPNAERTVARKRAPVAVTNKLPPTHGDIAISVAPAADQTSSARRSNARPNHSLILSAVAAVAAVVATVVVVAVQAAGDDDRPSQVAATSTEEPVTTASRPDETITVATSAVPVEEPVTTASRPPVTTASGPEETISVATSAPVVVVAAAANAPEILNVATFQEGELVYLSLTYADADGDASGFGFQGANGSRWAAESHTFVDPSYGRVSDGQIDYPFNHSCGSAEEYESDVAVWIYDLSGRQSEPMIVHLACY